MKLKEFLKISAGNVSVFDENKVCIGSIFKTIENKKLNNVYCFNDQGKVCHYSYWLKPFENCKIVSVLSESFIGCEVDDYYKNAYSGEDIFVIVNVTDEAEQTFKEKTGRRRMTANDWIRFYGTTDVKLSDEFILNYKETE